MDPLARGVVAAIVCCALGALLANAVAGRIFVDCVRLNPCPNFPSSVGACIGVSEVCRPASLVLWLTLIVGAVAGVVGGFVAYGRSPRVGGA